MSSPVVADYAHWWQELVEMLRKFMMTGVLMFVDSGTFEQILVGVGFSIVFMTLQFKYQPFEDDIGPVNASVIGHDS